MNRFDKVKFFKDTKVFLIFFYMALFTILIIAKIRSLWLLCN